MRVSRVIGRVTLSQRLADVPAGRFVIVQPLSAAALRCAAAADAEPLVAFDPLYPGMHDRVGITEGREAAMPFHPQPVPFDAYCAAVLESVQSCGAEK